jgi:hypothetical protein
MSKDLTYRDFLIPKKNGKPRRISAPSKGLLKYQRRLLPFLVKHHQEETKALNINHIQHGFIPNRNCVTAASMHIGFKYTICMDLSNFFDSCNKSMFPREITKYEPLFHKQGHCAQGFATSPILANIASIEFVYQLNKELEDLHSGTSNQEYQMVNYDKYAFTIYADDIQISTNNRLLIKEIIDLVELKANQSAFSINKNKTRVRSSESGYRKILGINVGDDHIRATRHTMRRIRAADHQGNFHSCGGLTAWSKCYYPRALKGHTKSFFKA